MVRPWLSQSEMSPERGRKCFAGFLNCREGPRGTSRRRPSAGAYSSSAPTGAVSYSRRTGCPDCRLWRGERGERGGGKREREPRECQYLRHEGEMRYDVWDGWRADYEEGDTMVKGSFIEQVLSHRTGARAHRHVVTAPGTT